MSLGPKNNKQLRETLCKREKERERGKAQQGRAREGGGKRTRKTGEGGKRREAGKRRRREGRGRGTSRDRQQGREGKWIGGLTNFIVNQITVATSRSKYRRFPLL